jgi:ubiquinone/menaquinone biosynthesis C-methylase UbiE
LGYDPFCFIDVDPDKQHKTFAERYEVLSISEAVCKYGVQTIFVTLSPQNQQKAINSLKMSGYNDVVTLDKPKLDQRQRTKDNVAAADVFLEFGRYSKRILDLGCGGGRITKAIADFFNVQVTGIDIRCKNESGEGYSIEQMDSRKMRFEENSFDAIISIATLEHISGLDQVLAEMYRVLRPNGRVYMTGGPIWTCGWGHHYENGIEFNPVSSILPRYSHLYFSKEQMAGFLYDNDFKAETVDYVTQFIYESDYLNRYSASQIVEQVMESGFYINEIKQSIFSGSYNQLSDESRKKLKERYRATDLVVGEITLKLLK